MDRAEILLRNKKLEIKKLELEISRSVQRVENEKLNHEVDLERRELEKDGAIMEHNALIERIEHDINQKKDALALLLKEVRGQGDKK